MSLTPAEEYVDKWDHTQVDLFDLIHEIQADALRFAAEHVKGTPYPDKDLRGVFQSIAHEKLLEIANQLHPLPEAKPEPPLPIGGYIP